MQVHRNPAKTEELLDALTEEITEDRSGQHPSVSDLCRCLTASYLDWRASGESGSPSHSIQTRVFFLTGLGIERALLANRREDSALSGCHEGVFYHVDGVQLDGDGLVELKTTRASKKKFDAGEFPELHIRQMKSYCVVKGVTEIDYGVVFLIPGEFEVWRIEFGEEELREHWQWMEARRDLWVSAMETGREPQPFRHNLDWECDAYGGCRWKLLCTMRASLTPRLVQ